MLPVPLHVVLNHLYVMSAGAGGNGNGNGNGNGGAAAAAAATDAAVLVTGLTQRFKPNLHTRITHKFVTTVYYAPKAQPLTGADAVSVTGGTQTGTATAAALAGPFAPFPAHMQQQQQQQQPPVDAAMDDRR